MDYWGLFTGQLIDPFRIALLVGLLLTMHNTRQAAGRVVPALAGIGFVAALMPMTMTKDLAPFWPQFATGLAANALILAVLAGAWALIGRARG